MREGVGGQVNVFGCCALFIIALLVPCLGRSTALVYRVLALDGTSCLSIEELPDTGDARRAPADEALHDLLMDSHDAQHRGQALLLD